MKLGICYMVFDGEELLEFAIKSIRKNIDFVSVTYQDTSYFGNKTEGLFEKLDSLKKMGLIDELIFFEPDFSVHHKDNELKLRNIGLEASRKAGCTHHISSDVDEFYVPEQLEYVKGVMEGDYNYSVVYMEMYYKEPTYMVWPSQNLVSSFIHPVHNEYTRYIDYPTFPFHMETTRRFTKVDKYRLFTKDEFTLHHMSHVRKDLRKKYANSDNARFYRMNKFMKTYDNYKLGDKVILLPDYLVRRTKLVENQFGIHW